MAALRHTSKFKSTSASAFSDSGSGICKFASSPGWTAGSAIEPEAVCSPFSKTAYFKVKSSSEVKSWALRSVSVPFFSSVNFTY